MILLQNTMNNTCAISSALDALATNYFSVDHSRLVIWLRRWIDSQFLKHFGCTGPAAPMDLFGHQRGYKDDNKKHGIRSKGRQDQSEQRMPRVDMVPSSK